jgi:BMFP domain-containing protein YqiC
MTTIGVINDATGEVVPFPLDGKASNELTSIVTAASGQTIALGGIIREELQENFKAVLQSGLAKLDLVTREEFDVQRAVLLRCLRHLGTRRQHERQQRARQHQAHGGGQILERLPHHSPMATPMTTQPTTTARRSMAAVNTSS